MASENTLATVLNDAGGKALVEQYLERKFLEREEKEFSLANSKFLDNKGIPANDGQYVKFTRLGRFRRPQTMDRSTASNEYADPSSGALMTTETVTLPVEWIQEYVGVSTIASKTSWIDLDRWIEEDMPYALQSRMHELTQNAAIVGRYAPGQWSSTSTTASTAFDASAQRSVTWDGVTFKFKKLPTYYANAKATFAGLDLGTDRIKWTDVARINTKLALAGAPMVEGGYAWHISAAVQNDLISQDEYFQAAIRSFDAGLKGLVKNQVARMYRGAIFILDENPHTEAVGAENARATNGPIHSCIVLGKNAMGYINLGGKGVSWRPKFKVQDITKTGVLKTIGYLAPFQAGVLNEKWGAVVKAPVSEYLPNGTDA